MGEPASSGSIQRMITLSGLQIVTGASGFSGFCAVFILKVSEKSLAPIMFLAFTFNLRLTPDSVVSNVNSVDLT